LQKEEKEGTGANVTGANATITPTPLLNILKTVVKRDFFINLND